MLKPITNTISKLKTIYIKFLDLDGKEQKTSLTLDWNTIRHEDTICICQLQENLKKGKGTFVS